MYKEKVITTGAKREGDSKESKRLLIGYNNCQVFTVLIGNKTLKDYE